ncbi:MAG TPA: glycosyltransferase [Steroidobacteraceae bacterium]
MISIIVNFFNNRREAKNTLHSLSAGYLRNASNISYEVIAVDNGSQLPLSEDEVSSFGPQFRYRYFATQSRSPVDALNTVCSEAKGDELMIMIDGAHLLSPGILDLADQAFRSLDAPIIATVPFHLGPKVQNVSVGEGYNQEKEEDLLRRCGWRADGYRLYDVAGSYADGSKGWFGCLFESGCLGIRKRDFLSMQGFDKRFQSPGGGMANPDILQRALRRSDLQYVVLLGEGTFHQVHGGVASNSPWDKHPWKDFEKEYAGIRGAAFARTLRRPMFLGSFPQLKSALKIAKHSAEAGLTFWLNGSDISGQPALPHGGSDLTGLA